MMTDEEYAAKYEMLTSELVDDYMRSLPADDPAKAQSDADDAENKRRSDTAKAGRAADMAKNAARQEGRLTTDDKVLHLWVVGRLFGEGLPATPAVRRFTQSLLIAAYTDVERAFARFYQSEDGVELRKLYEADASRDASIKAGYEALTPDVSKFNTPEGQLLEQRRVMGNLNRLRQIVEVSADAKPAEPLTAEVLRSKLNEAASASPEALARMMRQLVS